MNKIIFNIFQALLFMLALSGCEVGITPLDHDAINPEVSITPKEPTTGDYEINGESGVNIAQIGNLPGQVSIDDIRLEIEGAGSENFEGSFVLLDNNMININVVPKDGFTAKTDTLFDLNVTVYILDSPSCTKPIPILLAGTNTQPVAIEQNVTTDQDTNISIVLTAEDADNDSLTYTLESNTSHGTVVMDANVVTYSPNPHYVGDDSFTFLVNDGFTNSNIETVHINVEGTQEIDGIVPVITVNGTDVSVVQNTLYTDAGATATDNVDTTVNVTTSGSVDTATVGTYTITYTATDAAGNTAIATRTVTVTDGIAPVITVNGTDVSVVQNTLYSDAGATATDNVDTTVNMTTSGSVDTATVGTYTITYTATDNAGNTATATRTVTVTDGIAPVITVNGTDASVVQNTLYTDAGATATDNVDTTVTVTTAGSVDTTTVGIYTITYTATDRAGNTATTTRMVTVTDGIPPVITLLGDAVVNVVLNGTYVDAGVNALDNIDADITANVITVNPVNVNQVGTYVITYNVQDTAGNIAREVTRTVNVSDVSAPAISLLGTTPVDIEYGSTYTDPGATALDAEDGDLSSFIVIGGDTVDTYTLGTYTITYDVNDSSGQDAIQVQRVVNVIDTTKPIITLNGAEKITLEAGTTYVELNATAMDNLDGDLSSQIIIDSSEINMAIEGNYTVTYNISDTQGNAADEVVRTVIIKRTIPLPYVFSWCDDEHGIELWGSDGSEVNTTILKDINLQGNSNPSSILEINGTYFFSAYDSEHGVELWKSEGTPDSTVLVKDINDGNQSANPKQFIDVNGTLFFVADDGVNGKELWKSDGTGIGTVMVANINEAGNSTPEVLTDVEGILFFTADDGMHGIELWKSDGTEQGTILVEDMTIDGSTTIVSHTVFNGLFVFSAKVSFLNYQLFSSDGNTITQIGSFETSITGQTSLTAVNDMLYFSAYDTEHRRELWHSDGTYVEIAADINKDYDSSYLIGNSYPEDLMDVNGTLYFTATETTDGVRTLWTYDEFNGVQKIGGSKNNPTNLININGTLYFSESNNELYKVLTVNDNGTFNAQVVKVFTDADGLSDFKNVNGVLYFRVIKNTEPDELWTSESMVADVPHPIVTGCTP